MRLPFKVLAIETSCDDTAVAIVSSCRRVLSSVIVKQHRQHEAYQGIVPRLAAQLHRQNLPSAIRRCITESGLTLGDVGAVAATRGPGLAGCLSVGYEAGRCIAGAAGLPFYGVHHMEGHALTARLSDPSVKFPFLAFLISGGHTLLVLARGQGDYSILGRSLDDNVGEALDKAKRMLRIPSLGGESPAAALEFAATQSTGATPQWMPRAMAGDASLDFSFSGLKTALKYHLEKSTEMNVPDLAFEFQRAATAHLEDRLQTALIGYSEDFEQVVISGGVARNKYIRSRLAQVIEDAGKTAVFAPSEYCSDNAVMIGWAAIEAINAGRAPLNLSKQADIIPDWPLDTLKY